MRHLVVGVVLSIPGCNSRDDLIAGICGSLRDCTGYMEEDLGTCEKPGKTRGETSDERTCKKELKDALEDRRITRTALARCADCISNENNTKEPCDELLIGRDCDVACEEIGFVLNAHTSTERRCDVCNEFVTPCTGVPACGIKYPERLEDKLTHDVSVGACVNCIHQVLDVARGKAQEITAGAGGAGAGGLAGASSMAGMSNAAGAGGASIAGSTSCGGDTDSSGGPVGGSPDAGTPTQNYELCHDVVTSCAAECELVEGIKDAVDLAADRFFICERNLENCELGDAGAGAGGSDGMPTDGAPVPTSETGGSAGMPNPMDGAGSRTAWTNACVSRFVACGAVQATIGCASCARNTTDCDGVRESCASSCKELFEQCPAACPAESGDG